MDTHQRGRLASRAAKQRRDRSSEAGNEAVVRPADSRASGWKSGSGGRGCGRRQVRGRGARSLLVAAPPAVPLVPAHSIDGRNSERESRTVPIDTADFPARSDSPRARIARLPDGPATRAREGSGRE